MKRYKSNAFIVLLAICATSFISISIAAPNSRSTQSGAPTTGPIEVIFDTDFSVPPQDDGMALALALKSPELQILAVTTVAGNDTVQRATSDALRELEIAGRTDIPVYRGANRPWMHEKSEWATTVHGKWWSDEPPPTPPGGFAKRRPENESAMEYIIRTVNANPGQITIIAIGPLTNIAMAIRQEPGFAQKVKSLAIMGGAIASLADGGGNVTPNAEFNIWVDPEAAQVVFRSGIPIVLTPLNVTRKTNFTKEYFDKIVAVDTPLTRLMKDRMAAGYAANPNRRGAMFDEVTVATLIDPTLAKTVDLMVDVDINKGPDYGTTVGAKKIWEGGEGAKMMTVQYDLDFERLMRMFIERVTKP